MTWDEPYFFERQHDVREWLFQFFGTSAEQSAAVLVEPDWRKAGGFAAKSPTSIPVPSLLSLATGMAGEGLIGPLGPISAFDCASVRDHGGCPFLVP